ncbi:thioredoxin domain-containing protein [Streptococcus caprae]|uniref:Thioredoxin domain-containing protein n=1 Tax=Streptococcus caprae TaxID=1640501 RepID=A0ABV8CUC6_9STRE
MDFNTSIANFTKVSAKEAEAKIASGEKFVLFIGRATCPYCQRFAPKLAAVAQATGQAVAFLNSEDSADMDGITALRQTYGVPTVPGLLVAENGDVKVICDSSLPEETITEFIGA